MEESENQETQSQPTLINDDPPSKRRLFIPMIVILVLVVGALMAIKASVQKNSAAIHEEVDLTEGATIPDLSLFKLDGTKVMLSDLPHKVMLINFWATWCEACVEEMPSINALRDKYQTQGFEVLGVNVDENPAGAAPPMVEKLKMKFPIFGDQKAMLADIFDLHAIPLTVIINKDRKILYTESGGRDWNSEEIHQMMAKWLQDE